MNKVYYFDNGATTPVDPEVLKAMKPLFNEDFGNPASIHFMGEKAKELVDNARKIIADSINAEPSEIIFTSGGTESNNFVIKGVGIANKDKGNHIITTRIEHDCVLNACKWMEKQGFKVTYLKVDKQGFIDLEELESSITDKTLLVSVIHGNNEIGTIQDIKEIGRICKSKGVYFHTDACQSYTKTSIDVKKMNIDFMTINSHKIHGPKGVGALYIKKGTRITPLLHGGGQENGFRSGTLNVPGIVGFAKAVEVAKPEHVTKMRELRDYVIHRILNEVPDTFLNGAEGDKRLCNNINIVFDGIDGEALLMYLSDKGICVSTGSACASRSLEPSHVLRSIGLSHKHAHGAIRITLSRFNTKEECDYLIEQVKENVKKLRAFSPFK